MTWLLGIVGGAKLYVIGGAILAGALAIWRVVAGVKKSGVDQQKAKQAEDRDANLKRIKDAANVRPIGSVHDDPYNRDR